MAVRILDATDSNHVANVVVRDMQFELEAIYGWTVDRDEVGHCRASQLRHLRTPEGSRVLKKLGRLAMKWRRPPPRSLSEDAGLAILMNYTQLDGVERSLKALRGRRAALLFDVWEPQIPLVASFFQEAPLDHLGVTSRQSAEILSRQLSHLDVRWIPESLGSDSYVAPSLRDRPSMVVEFGRRFAQYHDAIRPLLFEVGVDHRYEKHPGQLVVNSKAEFLRLLAQARVCVCFPRTKTHPETAGSIETMTLRYLQCMAAGSVVIGHAPAEMVDLFGYDPVVPVDWANPAGQIVDIVSNPEPFQALVDRNRDTVEQNHTWAKRSRIFAKYLTGSSDWEQEYLAQLEPSRS